MIELEQQTPMWHFQPDEPGCCLRATEVKPKLDRFIAEMRRRKGKKDNIEPPFNYKMSFEAIGEKTILPSDEEYMNRLGRPVSRNLYPLFFGNVKAEHPKELVFYPDGIKMHLFSLDTDLLKEISGYINRFFAQTTFGTRQDKGFGAFYPKGQRFETADACYSFETMYMDRSQYPELFRYIHYFHKMIRSGINENNNYYKSFMYFYAQSLGQTWDKPVIRYNFQMFNPVYKHLSMKRYNERFSQYRQRESMKTEREQFEKEDRYRNSSSLFRDALGLSSVQQWKSYNTNVSVDCVEGDVERFKSPILYRPAYIEGQNGKNGKYRVYIYLSEINNNFMDAGFRFKADKCGQNHTTEYMKTIMKVYPQFSLEGYLDFIIEHCKSGAPICSSGRNKYADFIFTNRNGRVNFRKL